jgi:two-component system, NarL family, response regulator LiaR
MCRTHVRTYPDSEENMQTISLLIIDEYPGARDVLARRLASLPSFIVHEVTGNPLLAGELARERKPDVIIADFKRGGLPRAEIYRWIRSMSPSSHLVVLTSFLDEDEREACRITGVSRCLLKGITVRELAAELRELMGGPAPGPVDLPGPNGQSPGPASGDSH